jgi:hypothetical protein
LVVVLSVFELVAFFVVLSLLALVVLALLFSDKLILALDECFFAVLVSSFVFCRLDSFVFCQLLSVGVAGNGGFERQRAVCGLCSVGGVSSIRSV